MKNTFGQSVSMTVFGESHGEAVGVVIDGIAPGIDVDENYIKACLAKELRPRQRTPQGEKRTSLRLSAACFRARVQALRFA